MSEWEYGNWKKQNYEQYITDMIEYMSTCKRKNCLFLNDNGVGCERNYIGLDYAISACDIQEWEKYKEKREKGEILDYSNWERFCDTYINIDSDEDESSDSDTITVDVSQSGGKTIEEIIQEAIRDAIEGGKLNADKDG